MFNKLTLFQWNSAAWALLGIAFLAASTSSQRCSYGDRGSLTSTCVNATPNYFKQTNYKFDHLDETLRCQNCNLSEITGNSFDISGNSIQFLDLSNSNINSMKESAFVGLVFLKELYLQNNKIKTIVPGTFRGIKKVENLIIANNSISALLDDGMKELIQLKKLDLNNNTIKSIYGNAFNGLGVLQELKMNHNQLSNVKEFLKSLVSLQYLDIYYNEISEINPGDFDSQIALTYLNLAKNKLNRIKDNSFRGLYKLTQLDLSANPLENLDPGAFRGLLSLTDLNLESCRILTLDRRVLTGVHSLKVLNLANNIMTDFATGTFNGLPELRSLNLSGNNLESFNKSGVRSLGNLHTLDVSYNKIKSFDYKDLINHVPVISFLGLKGNDFPCYLKKDMTDFFLDDNIVFEFNPTESTEVCIRPSTEAPAATTATNPKTGAMEKQTSGDTGGSDSAANAYVVYSFLTLVFLLLGLLFFLHFRPMFGVNYFRGKGVENRVLVCVSNNDLEGREDYA